MMITIVRILLLACPLLSADASRGASSNIAIASHLRGSGSSSVVSSMITTNDDDDNLLLLPCDESFPTLSTYPYDATDTNQQQHHRNRQQRRLVAVPNDETGQSYAPLCSDGYHIDVRELQRCNSGSCWSEYINQCTFECKWGGTTDGTTDSTTDRITVKPTPQPTKKIIQTDNFVKLQLEELQEAYRVSQATRDAIIAFVQKLLEDKLGYQLEVLGVEFQGQLPGEPDSLPMKIVASGPEDISQFSELYIMETIRDNEGALLAYLKKLDGGDPFLNVSVEVAAYNPDGIVGPSDQPTARPSASPPVEGEVAVQSKIQEATGVEEPEGIPWWVWLLVALAVLSLCCFCCGCWYWNHQSNSNSASRMTSGTRKTTPRRGSDNAGRMTSRSRRRPSNGENASRRTSGTRKASRTTRARTMVSQSFTRQRLPQKQHHRRITEEREEEEMGKEFERELNNDQTVNGPAMEAVRAIPTRLGFDPPEECNKTVGNSMVVYDRKRDPSMYDPGNDEGPSNKSRKKPRDPTMYIEQGQALVMYEEERCADPEGLKISRKQSMFAAEAVQLARKISLSKLGDIDAAGEDPSEFDPNSNRRDPSFAGGNEGDYPTESSKNKNKKKKKGNSRSQRKTTSSRRSKRTFGDRLASSFTWNTNSQPSAGVQSEDTPGDGSFKTQDPHGGNGFA